MTWANPDGTMTSEVHAAPVRFKDSAGRWQDINLSLVESPDGTVAPRNHEHDLALGGASATTGGVFASVTAGPGRQIEWLAPWKLPKPTLNGTKATYREIQPGVDLILDARRSGFEHDFVVKQRPASVPVWRIPLRTKGLTAKAQQDGSIQFIDAKNVVRSVIPVAYMWDAVTDPDSGLPASTTRVKVTVEQQSPGRATLVVAPDAAWFLDSSRVFPVTVDPTYATGSAVPSFDTWVQSDVTTDQSASAELRVGSWNGGATKTRSFLNFPTAPFRAKQILGATLSLFESYSQSCTPSTFVVKSANTASSATRWTTQPATGGQYGSATAAKGNSSSCPAARVSVPITGLADAWSTASYTTGGLALVAADETDSNGWKRFHSTEGAGDPYITLTWNRAPGTPAVPAFATAVAYAAPGGSSVLYTPYRKPWVQTKATDADGNNVRYSFEFHNSTTVSATSLKATCGSTPGQPSGTTDGCTPTADLPDNTAIYVRAKSTDGYLESSWSGWRLVRVGTQAPAVPTISCPSPYVINSWQDNSPAGNIVCTISAPGTGFSAPGYVRALVDGRPYATNFAGGSAGQIKITPSNDPAVAKTTVTIPNTVSGLHRISVQAETPAGKLSGSAGYSFGWGNAALNSPTANPRMTTTGAVKIEASGPPRGSAALPTATLRWRVSGYGVGHETVGWNIADTPLTVIDSGAAGINVTGLWDATSAQKDEQLDADPSTPIIDATDLSKRLPVLLDVQVCLKYASSTQCTWSSTKTTVQRVPHAFGEGFPTASAGPGQVALWTGEFNAEVTDVSVPGYTGDLSISRSHSTYAGANSYVNSVFGPGWTAHFDGAEAGAAGAEVVDSTRLDGTIALVDGDGSALVWIAPTEARRTGASFATGDWLAADEETELDGSKLTIAGSGTATIISYVEDDGTVTTFTPAAAPTAAAAVSFRPVGIAEPGIGSKTTYSYDGSGRVARILAPAPPGVICPATGNLSPGCRALRFVYGTDGDSAGRLTEAWLDIFNPAKAGGAGMDSIKVSTFAYGSGGHLVTATDPRSNLSTEYGYNAASHLISIKPAGQIPYQLVYTPSGDSEKLSEVRRDRPAGDSAGGTAQLAKFFYDVPLSGPGLPDLGPSSVGRWGQGSPPAKGFAVFGPDRTVSGSPTDADWPYADLKYTDAFGYSVNTANYGAGDWQYTATDYDEQGNVIRELDERALRLIIDQQVPAGASADQLATLTVYNSDIKNSAGDTVVTPAGSMVTDEYGPARFAALSDGTIAWLRPHTRSYYDEAAPNQGINPDTSLPYRLTTTQTLTAQDPGSGEDLQTISRILTDYTAPVADDADGWRNSQPGRVITDVNPGGPRGETTGDIVRLTRFDAEGRVIETRQPKSDGTDAGTVKTAYYTAVANAGSPECGNRPQWAGLICKVSPAAQPTSASGSTPALPTSSTIGYNYLLMPTTEVETSGSTTRTTNVSYLLDGRINTIKMSTSGIGSSTPTTDKQTGYDAATGFATTATATATDGTTSTITTGFDTWGRQTAYQTHGDTTTSTTYDAANRIATVADSNGTATYTYDGTDIAGRSERRGLPTKVEVTTAGSTWTSAGAYDADGALTIQRLPGGITQTTEADNAGEPIGLRYSGQITTQNSDGSTTVDPDGGWLSWSVENDITGRVSHEWTPDGAAFTGPTGDAPGDATPYDRAFSYDAAGRLTQVRDRTAAGTGVDVTDPATTPACITRSYGFDSNDNRLAKSTAPADANGNCTTQGGTTSSRTFDSADRPIAGVGGLGTYTYDAFGRALNLPAGDTPSPDDGTLNIAYYDNDLARSVTQGDTTTTFDLDSMDRRSVETTSTAGSSRQSQRHYTDDSDNPTWVQDGLVTRRYVELIGGDLAMTVDQTGKGELALANNHDDIIATVPLGTASTPASSLDAWSDYDEYGASTAGASMSTGPVQYGWLGSKQRATLDSGLVLMGSRIYNPTSGTFTSMDPVPGGNANAYNYPSDPINQVDLDGRQLDHRLGNNRGWGRNSWREESYPRNSSRSADNRSYPKFHGGRGFYRNRRREHDSRGQNRYRSCRRNSFTPETLVTMADGTMMPISKVSIGDLVLATDLATGRNGAFPVTDVIFSDDVKRLVDITVAPAPGKPAIITATDQHPIFDTAKGEFVDAASLSTASSLRTPNGDAVNVRSVSVRTQSSQVFNLTVGTAHTFYVSAAGQSFLTHNCRNDRLRKKKKKKKNTGGRTYKNRREAEKAAKRDAKVGGRCRYRGVCKKNDHVHVDYYNKHGEISETVHYNFPKH